MRSSRSSTAPDAGRVCVERLREPTDVARRPHRDGRRGRAAPRRPSGAPEPAVRVAPEHVRPPRRAPGRPRPRPDRSPWRPHGRRLRAPRRGGSARARHEAPPPRLAPARPCPRPAPRAPPAARVRSLRRAPAPRCVVSGRRECSATTSRASCPLRTRCSARRTRRAGRAGAPAARAAVCANWPESASSRSVAATRSSRATLRPHA